MNFSNILAKMQKNADSPLGKTLNGFGQGMANADSDTPLWEQLIAGAGGASGQGIKGYRGRKKPMKMVDSPIPFTDTFNDIYHA